MASLLIVYSEHDNLYPPPMEQLPPKTRVANLNAIAELSDANIETLLRMLLKQMER